MIVRNDGLELVLITQPDHAGLSGRIIDAWQADGLPRRARRSTVLLATREHDNGWREVDAAPTVNPRTGRPHDFVNAPGEIKRAIWPRGVARLAPTDPMAAALVAQHALTVLDRDATPPWRTFFAAVQAERDRLLADGAYDGELPRLLDDYRLVFLGDLLSLVFCCGWRRRFDRQGYGIVLKGTTLSIDPDPFAGANVPLAVAARQIPNRRYRSAGELGAALARAPEIELIGLAVGYSS